MMKWRFMHLVGSSEWYWVRDTDPEADEHEREPTQYKPTERKQVDNRYVEAILYVPHTPESILKKSLTEMEIKLDVKNRVKYEEELWIIIANKLVKIFARDQESFPIWYVKPDKRPEKTENMLEKVFHAVMTAEKTTLKQCEGMIFIYV